MINRLVRIESKDDLDPLSVTPIASISSPVLSLEDIAYLQNTGQQSLLDNILASTSSPSPSPTPSPAPILSNSCPPDPTPQPIAIPEAIAEAVRQGNQGPYNSFIVGMISPPYRADYTDTANLLALCNSEIPTVSSTVQQVELLVGFGCLHYVAMLYAGTGQLPTSVPGTTITDTIPAIPAPQMPNEVRPLINSITSAVTQQISSPILESSADLSTISTAIEAPYIADLEDISTTTTNLTGDIIRPQVTAINQLYDDTYPVGISPPTVDQIISGEIPYNPNLPPGASTCPAPIINVAPAAVSCPAPAAITFSPQITVNVPQQDRPTVSVSTAPITIDVPAPVPAPVAEVPEAPIVEVVPSPSPSPSPAPTPIEEPAFEAAPEEEEYIEEPPVPDPASPNIEAETAAYDAYHNTPSTPNVYPVAMDWSSTAPCLAFQAQSAAYATNWAHKLFGVDKVSAYYGPFSWLKAIPLVGDALNDGLFSLTGMLATTLELRATS